MARSQNNPENDDQMMKMIDIEHTNKPKRILPLCTYKVFFSHLEVTLEQKCTQLHIFQN